MKSVICVSYCKPGLGDLPAPLPLRSLRRPRNVQTKSCNACRLSRRCLDFSLAARRVSLFISSTCITFCMCHAMRVLLSIFYRIRTENGPGSARVNHNLNAERHDANGNAQRDRTQTKSNRVRTGFPAPRAPWGGWLYGMVLKYWTNKFRKCFLLQ